MRTNPFPIEDFHKGVSPGLPRPNPRAIRKYAIGCLGAATLVVLLCAIPIIVLRQINHEMVDFYNRCYQIELNMDKIDVLRIMGREPDLKCRWKTYESWYFRPPPDYFGITVIGERSGSDEVIQVESPDSPLGVYNWQRLVFDGDGRLIAYGTVGESKIWSVLGDFPVDRYAPFHYDHEKKAVESQQTE
jgi:hypothetical protein